MQRTGPVVAILIALAVSANAAEPAQLVAALAQAVHNRDVAGFIAHTSVASRRALAGAQVTQARLRRAQLGYQAALDQRFGKGHAFPPPAPPDRAAILSRVVNLAFVSVQLRTPTLALLHLRTSARVPPGSTPPGSAPPGSAPRGSAPGAPTVEEDDTLPAVREGGQGRRQWKLDLTGLARSATLSAASEASAYERITREIRAGMFKDRVAALIALLQAERGEAAEAGK
jgi:hypothetical protein